MEFKTPGRCKRWDEFNARWKAIAPELASDEVLYGADGALGKPYTLKNKLIGNRWAIHPMEGWDGTGDGLPSEDTLRRWQRFGLSGAKLIWGGEAVAVMAEGRANPHQLYVNPSVDTRAGLAQLREALIDSHESTGAATDDIYIGLQLTHSGRFCRPTGDGPAPRIAYRHPVLDARAGVQSDDAILSDMELEGITERYVQAATHAQAAGFEFVDVKCCHGYLLHELLGAKTRPGPYGGSFENRTRFFRETVAAIRSACPGLDIGVRVSIGDLHPFSPGEDRRGEPTGWNDSLPYTYGFGVDEQDPRRVDLTESFLLLELLRGMGISLVNLTLGSPYYNPHLQRPAAYPPSDGYQPPEDPLHQVAEHLRITRQCKSAYPDLALVGTGYSYLQEWLPNVAQHELAQGHVDFVGLGRMVLSYPELPLHVLRGQPLERKKICRTFSDCTTGPRNGLRSGCYPLDAHYKVRPDYTILKEIKERMN
ncbi:MAG: NADH:flavin oxidoreductase [bacterium]|nr:NADH:flavin oxidoreductase [Deltaproteobacteria bacterium]MCP4905619.1 NADH:flavin oxidoreductase [bacterium]